MPVVDIKGVGKAQFPDEMPITDIRNFLRNKYSQQAITGQSDILQPVTNTASPYEPTLTDKFGQGVADVLTDTGIISNRYGAQRIGENVSSLGEFLPGFGDAVAGEEFGTALAEGDFSGMALAGLGAVPVVGDVAKKAIEPMSEVIGLMAKRDLWRNAKMDVYGLPTKGKAENITDVTDLFDYTPEQLVSQIKNLDQVGIRQGGYYKKGEGLDIFYNNDGTSKMIDPKTGDVIFDQSKEQTENLIKSDILDIAKTKLTPEQQKTAYQARKKVDDANNAREKAQQETYKMQHTAPMREDNSTGTDLTPSYGDDIYSSNAKQYFGTGLDYDQKAINIIKGMKDKPNRSVTIYRSVPDSVKEINKGDWVATTKEYARDHMEGEKNWHILSKKVKAKDIATDGNSIHEWGYDPEG